MARMEQQVVYRTREMQRIEAAWHEPMGEILARLYVIEGKTVQQVGDELGITKGAASRWLERFGIEIRRAGRAS
jgi:hypothetical protein